MSEAKWITEREVAHLLGVSVTTVRRDRYSASPLIPFTKSGAPGSKGRVWYREAEVKKLASEWVRR